LFYDRVPEESRLASGQGRLEFERTRELLARVLPAPPARIVDVGGAAGDYSLWLAGQGYEVHLVDVTPRLVEEARKRSAQSATPLASLSVADARRLSQEDELCAAVILLGPLYHLPEAAGFQDVEVLGVEGPAWLLPDFDARWDDPALRKDLLDVARALESAPSATGISAHLLGIARKP
jgi:hypothetical protein